MKEITSVLEFVFYFLSSLFLLVASPGGGDGADNCGIGGGE